MGVYWGGGGVMGPPEMGGSFGTTVSAYRELLIVGLKGDVFTLR